MCSLTTSLSGSFIIKVSRSSGYGAGTRSAMKYTAPTHTQSVRTVIAQPLLIFTLGLFTFVINALLLSLLTLLLPFFHITGADGKFSFGYAFLGAFIISVISLALNLLTGNARVSVQHRRPPPGPSNGAGGGNGPVIDV